MTNEYTILKEGTNDKVLVEWNRGERKEYSVHTKGCNGGLIWGHYFTTYKEALEDFNKRI